MSNKRGVRFSDAYLKKLKLPPGRREVIQFEPGTGLGVRVSATGQISFIVQLRLKDGTRWRETLGVYGKLTVEAARHAAQAVAGDIAKGVDLRLRAREAEAAAKAKAVADEAKLFTVRALIERWKRDSLSALRPSYAVRAAANVERAFKTLFDVPATALTRGEVRKALEVKRTQKQKRRGAARASREDRRPPATPPPAYAQPIAGPWTIRFRPGTSTQSPERTGPNFRVQGLAADMMKLLMIRLTEADIAVCAAIHDGFLIECGAGEADAVFEQVKATMARRRGQCVADHTKTTPACLHPHHALYCRPGRSARSDKALLGLRRRAWPA
ncbi:MAG TPA: integrase arm-type DNA-binding domain-containing protein [Roseiarcus sp.]|jgi:hypothetical protein|nr:integrase arm-type DNA-binding domain-containing protein [Roseiarcus sp.]